MAKKNEMRSDCGTRTIAFWICLVAAMIWIGAALAPLRGQEASLTIDTTFEFDDRGDAKIEKSFQLGAKAWKEWKERWGDHPDILLRDLRYDLASAVIEDYGLDKDDIHRHATAKFKARALARYRDDGQFTIDIPKHAKLVMGSGHDWAFTSSSLANGGIFNQTIHFKLPVKAQNAHYSPGDDFDQLTYTLEIAPPRPKAWLELGIVLVIAGAAMGLVAFRPVGKTAGSAPVAST